MPKLLTREQNIKKVMSIRRMERLMYKLRGSKLSRVAQEVYVDTEYGKVKTLWYGIENKEVTPVIFDLHGGGFVMLHAGADETMNIELNKKTGCKVVSINYPKAPEYPYPAAVNQVYAVVKQVQNNPQKYAIDNQKMAIGGQSAGANLSAVTCMKTLKQGEFHFVCQFLNYPPLDLATSPFDKPQPKGSIPPQDALMFNDCYVDPAQARDVYVSPVYAKKEDLEGLPPTLFILAGGDSLHDEGYRYYEMLKAAGVAAEIYDYPNSAHGFTYKTGAEPTDALGKISDFLKKYFS